MKTAISIPDETFARAERHAAALGVSRSEFFTRAARRYIEQLEAESLTGRINLAMDMVWPEGIEVDYPGHGHGAGWWHGAGLGHGAGHGHGAGLEPGAGSGNERAAGAEPW